MKQLLLDLSHWRRERKRTLTGELDTFGKGKTERFQSSFGRVSFVPVSLVDAAGEF